MWSVWAEYCTLIKRQFCDIDFWTFALISYEAVSVPDTQFSVSSVHDPAESSAIWRPVPAAPLCGSTSRRRWAGWTQNYLFRIQVIMCNFHNIHNMWQGLICDVLGCNSKLRPSPAEYSGLIVDEPVSGTARDLLWHHCGASSHQRRNLPVYILSQKISKYSLDEECHEMKMNMKMIRFDGCLFLLTFRILKSPIL